VLATLKRTLPPRLRRRLRAFADFAFSDIEGVIAEKDITALGEKGLEPNACHAELQDVAADLDAYLAGLQEEEGTLGRRKARRYLRQGYRGYAAVRGGHPVGVVWSVRPVESRVRGIHPDLRWLRLRLADDEAYMFDMYIEPEQRGLAMCTALFRAGYRALRAQGVTRVKGYYVSSNKPALWMHRMAGYREVARVRVRRSFGVTWRYEYTPLPVRGGGAGEPAGVRALAPSPP
jgi:ribosomal protein S18 acetylase RimI-like enzyme